MAYISAYKRRQRKQLQATIIRSITHIWLGSLMGLLTAWLLINWITGCGDITRTIDGHYVHGTCVFVPWVETITYMQ